MNILRFQRYDLLVILACLGLLTSFAWYAYKGPRGYAYRDSLEQKIEVLAADNAALVAEREALEDKVRLMRPEHVDRDMLEELARTELNMALPDELIVKVQN